MTTNHRILFTTALFLLTASVTYAAGLVPCGGGPPESMCRVCDFVAMGQGLMTWFIGASASIVALMFAFGGMKMVMSAGNTGKVSEGKEMMSNSIIGFFILLGAWLIVNTILMTVMSDGKGVEVWGTVQCVDNPTMTATMTGPSGGATTNTGPGGMTNPGGGSGIQCGSLNPACSVNALTAAGFTPSQANVMSCIAMTESSGNPTAQNKSGSACGTFQVIKSTWESAAKGTSCSSFSSCTNASCNAEVAKKLVSQSGYSSWTCANCNAKAQACITKYGP
ncbi:transglycosylase SLT domain-containing protein [Candidatus Kaiserbacteria bacterium]|nr:MAG: transglycosylase SLT domain-containing protein [Candidatus Kaiserbacteria bacterium]